MRIFLTTSYRTPEGRTGSAKTLRHPNLTRSFVETGDERCPLAGIWSSLPGLNDSLSEEGEIALPAMRKLLPWRALHSPLTSLSYIAA